MPRKNPPAKWVLPEVVNPEDSKCIRIFVPNEKYYVAAFWGALQSLGSAYNWADDLAHTAREVALVWRDVIDSISEVCGVIDVRQNESDPCILEKFDGTTWTVFAVIDLCAHDHPEYVAINPNTITRNTVTPAGNYPNLILNPFAGQTASLFEINGTSVSMWWLPTGQMNTSGSQAWRNGGAQFLQFQSAVGTSGFLRLAAHANYRNVSLLSVDPNQKLLVGDSTATATARAHIKNFLASLPVVDVQLASSQIAYALRILNSAGSLISGFDELGRLANVTGSGKPSDTIVRGGVQRVDTALQEIWVKGSNSGVDDWWKIGQKLENVDINMLPAGDPPSGSISGDTITINVPETELPPTPTPANYWFVGRQDRPLPGESIDFELVVMADGYTIFPCTLADGDELEIVTLRGWWDDQNFDPTGVGARPTGYNANGSLFTDPSAFTTLGSDPYTTEPHMCPIFEYELSGGSYSGLQINDGYFLTIADLNDVNPYGRLFANKEFFEGAGGIQLKISFTAVELGVLCETFDYVSSDEGFTIANAGNSPFGSLDYGGTYESGVGYKTAVRGSTPNANELVIFKTGLSVINLKEIRVYYSASGGAEDGWNIVSKFGNGSYSNTIDTLLSLGSAMVKSIPVSPGVDIDRVAFSMEESYTVGAQGIISKIELYC